MRHPMLANKNGFDAYSQLIEETEKRRQVQQTKVQRKSLWRELISLVGKATQSPVGNAPRIISAAIQAVWR